MNEERRYAAVNAQMKDLRDAAAIDPNPIVNLLRAMLHAELHERNELAHQHAMQARASFVQVLQARIERESQ